MDQELDSGDDLSRLGEIYQKDPAAFEEIRKRLIAEEIDKFPPGYRARAYGLQFRLDAELSRYKDPISRMNRMVEIFWDGVREFEAVITNPQSFMERKKSSAAAPGKIVPFPGGRKDAMH